MVADEANVRVRLDTREAQSSLRGLVRGGAAAAGRIGRNIRGVTARGLGAVGLGGAFAGGMAAVRGATQAGFGDVVSEALGGWAARVSEAILGEMPQEARAYKRTREETIAAFGAVVGAPGGKITPGMKTWFDQVKSLRLAEEKGRHEFEKDDYFRPEGGIKKVLSEIMKNVAQMIMDAAKAIADAIISALFG